MRRSITIAQVLNNMCPRAGESIILRTMCPHWNIEAMLSPRREHHLQLTKITTIGNCVLVCTGTLILKHMLSWRREHHSGGGLFSTCWSPWGHATPQLKADVKTKAISKTYENQRHPSVKTTGIWTSIWDAAWNNFDRKIYLQNHGENQSDTSVKTTGVTKTIEKTKKTRKPRFHNQWVAKAKEKTKQNQENQDVRTNG